MEMEFIFSKENLHNSIFISVIIILIFVWLIHLIVSLRKKVLYREGLKENIFMKNAVERLNGWLMAATFWMIIEYMCVILPFIANVIVIYLSAMSNAKMSEILFYSIVSLSFIIFGCAINPVCHKQSYRKAYSVLDNAINDYLRELDSNESLSNEQKKINFAIANGESIIDKSYDLD